MPDLTPADLAREAEAEAAVFAQAGNIDKLLTMLRGTDPLKDNLADNEEVQVGCFCRNVREAMDDDGGFLGTISLKHDSKAEDR